MRQLASLGCGAWLDVGVGSCDTPDGERARLGAHLAQGNPEQGGQLEVVCFYVPTGAPGCSTGGMRASLVLRSLGAASTCERSRPRRLSVSACSASSSPLSVLRPKPGRGCQTR